MTSGCFCARPATKKDTQALLDFGEKLMAPYVK